MDTILFLAHTEPDSSLGKVALEALTAATLLATDVAESELIVGLVGDDVQAAADGISGSGAGKVLGVAGADYGVSRYATDVAAMQALVAEAKASVVVAPATARMNRSMPGVAARTDGRIDTHVTGVSVDGGDIRVQRWYYRQRMVATIGRSQRPWIVVVESGVFEPWEGTAGSASVQAVAASLPDGGLRTEVVGEEAASGDAQTIRPEAELLFVSGAGWTKKQADGQTHVADAEKLILGFIEGAGASLGSSKSLVDQGAEGEEVLSFLSHLNQIGQTGATPRHPKGLSTCCHGEEPHVVGWRFVNERRAVNTDPNCGWAQGKADVLYVADAFEVMAKVNELLAGE